MVKLGFKEDEVNEQPDNDCFREIDNNTDEQGRRAFRVCAIGIDKRKVYYRPHHIPYNRKGAFLMPYREQGNAIEQRYGKNAYAER